MHRYTAIPKDVEWAMYRLRNACTTNGRLMTQASIVLTAVNRVYGLGNADKAPEAYARLSEFRACCPFEDAREASDELRWALERDYDKELKIGGRTR